MGKQNNCWKAYIQMLDLKQQETSEILTIAIRLIQDLRLDDLFDNIFKGDQAEHLIERVSLSLIIHPLHNGKMRVSWEKTDIVRSEVLHKKSLFLFANAFT